jgi:hypothetical protein
MKPAKKLPRQRYVWVIELASNNLPCANFPHAYRTRRAARGAVRPYHPPFKYRIVKFPRWQP